MFEFKVSLNDDDYLLFNKYHTLNSPAGKKSLRYFRWLIPFFCALVFAVFAASDFDITLIIIEAVLLAAISVLWVVSSKKMLLKATERTIRKLKKQGKLPYSSDAIVMFSEEYIQETTSDTDNKIRYSIIEKVAVTENAVYIYFNSVQAIIVPSAAFASDTQKQEFLDFINSKKPDKSAKGG